MGFVLYELFKKVRRGLLWIGATLLLLACALNGILGIYYSPYIFSVNWQTTYEDVSGVDWFCTYNNRITNVSEIGPDVSAIGGYLGYSHYWVGLIPGPTWDFVLRRSLGLHRLEVPDHFGYPFFERLADWYLFGGYEWDKYYIAVNKRFRVSQTDPILSQTNFSSPTYSRTGFNEADFERLEQDPSVSRLYANGEFEILQVFISGK